MAKYTIIIEKGEVNYSAYCPYLPGVVSAAETEEEMVELMKRGDRVSSWKYAHGSIPVKPEIETLR